MFFYRGQCRKGLSAEDVNIATDINALAVSRLTIFSPVALRNRNAQTCNGIKE